MAVTENIRQADNPGSRSLRSRNQVLKVLRLVRRAGSPQKIWQYGPCHRDKRMEHCVELMATEFERKRGVGYGREELRVLRTSQRLR